MSTIRYFPITPISKEQQNCYILILKTSDRVYLIFFPQCILPGCIFNAFLQAILFLADRNVTLFHSQNVVTGLRQLSAGLRKNAE